MRAHRAELLGAEIHRDSGALADDFAVGAAPGVGGTSQARKLPPREVSSVGTTTSPWIADVLRFVVHLIPDVRDGSIDFAC